MKTNKTAIVIVDDNNDFFTDGGKLHKAIEPFLNKSNMVDNLNRLLINARDRKVKVIRIAMAFEPGYPELDEEPIGIFSVVKSSDAFQKGNWGANVAEVIHGSVDDILIENKSSLCSFKSTSLYEILKREGVETIALAGLLTNLCIESTMRTAYDYGYEVVGLTDCTGALSDEQHNASINHNWPLISKPMTSTDLISILKD